VTPKSSREGGFTFLEMAAAVFILTIGLLALAGVLVSINHQREQAATKSLMLEAAQSLLEEIKSNADPSETYRAYHGTTYRVNGVTGNNPDGSALSVSVDAADPKLVLVNVNGSWLAAGKPQGLILQTQIYSPQGQKS